MAVNKIDPKVIFASEAPTQDTPAVFTNRTVGWGETRKNGGRPTIKQMNAEQQSTDLKILWLNENAVTPFDPTIDYPTNAVIIKDGIFKIFDGSVWEVFLDKTDIGLGNVDNTSDLDKPVSNETQTALDLKADKSYVDASLPHNNLIGRNSSGAHEAVAIVNSSGETQQQINDRGGAAWYAKSGGYGLNDRVILDSGDIVRSTVANNTTDPNVDMTNWYFTNPIVETTKDLLPAQASSGQVAYVTNTESVYIFTSGSWKPQKKYSINLKDYPRLSSETTDDGRFSRAIADLTLLSIKTITGLSAYSQQEIVIPAGILEVSNAIQIPNQAVIRSEGQTIIRQSDPTKNIFNCIDGFLLRVKGVKFFGGKHQIYFKNPNYDATVIIFENLEFWDSGDYAIKTLGTDIADAHLSAYAVAIDCKFSGCKRILYNVCDKFVFLGGWLYLYKKNYDANTAAIMNAFGEVVFDSTLGVPKLGAQDSDVDFKSNARWVDNYGAVRAINARFGGEDEGIPIIYNYARTLLNQNGAVISLINCQASAGHMSYRQDAGIVRLMTEVAGLIVIEKCNYVANSPYISVDQSLNLATYLSSVTDATSKIKIRIDANMSGGIGLTIPDELKPYASGDIIQTKKSPTLISKTSIDATKVKLVFEFSSVTDKQSFLLNVSGCQNTGGSIRYRDFSSFVFSTVVGNMTGVGVIRDIVYQAMPKPTSSNITSPTTKVIISSVYWGDGVSGNTYQLDTDTNRKFSVVLDNVSGSIDYTAATTQLLISN